MEFNQKLIRQLTETIEAENILFNMKTKAEKKVTIAQDCLIRIEANQIIPYTSMFIHKTEDLTKVEQPLQRQLNTPEMQTQCEVCAKGGLFLSLVARVNDFDKDQFSDSVVIHKIYSPEHTKLLEIFTARELAYIEFAFEGQQYLHKDENEELILFNIEETIKAQKFYDEYYGNWWGEFGADSFQARANEDPDENECRMIAILNNIIANNGEFIL